MLAARRVASALVCERWSVAVQRGGVLNAYGVVDAQGAANAQGAAIAQGVETMLVPQRTRVRENLGRALLATRPAGVSASFVVHRIAGKPGEGERWPTLIFSVPRRVLARAVDRNTVRRVGREVWRELGRAAGSRAVMIRLKRIPADFAAMPQRARKAHWRAQLASLLGSALKP